MSDYKPFHKKSAAQAQVTLLGKAKHTRPKDEADLANVLPTLGGDERSWLAETLTLVHPGHVWIDILRAPSAASA